MVGEGSARREGRTDFLPGALPVCDCGMIERDG